MSSPNPQILQALDGDVRYYAGQTVYFTYLSAAEITTRLAQYPEYNDLFGLRTFDDLTAAEQSALSAAIPLAFSKWAPSTSLRFERVPPDDFRASIRIGFYDLDSKNGFGSHHKVTNDVLLSAGTQNLEEATPGTQTFLTLQHEIGHALGLSDGDAVASTAATVADSIMAYAPEVKLDNVLPRTPMLHDVEKMTSIYGGGDSNSGPSTYSYAEWDGKPDALPMETLYDTGGIDTIDFSKQTKGTFIDLRDGEYSSFDTKRRQIGIAWGSKIENAIGGSSDDEILGNDLDNTLRGGQGNDTISGGQGYDVYEYSIGDGNDKIVDPDGGLLRLKAGPSDANPQLLSDKTFVKVPDEERWVNKFGTHTATLTHTDTWKITFEDTGVIDLGASFSDGDYGIHLVENILLPQEPNKIVGDLKPIDQDLSQDGIQLGYDALGNVLVYPTVMEPGFIDVLYDSAGNDLIQGLAGDDVLISERGGIDKVEGGTGSDFLISGGTTVLLGGDGSDVVRSFAGDSSLYAGSSEISFDDAIAQQNASGSGLRGDYLDGGADNDLLIGDTGNDGINGGLGHDRIVAGGGDDNIDGDLQISILSPDWSIVRTVSGNSYTLTFNGFSFPQDTSGGDDEIYAGAGADWVMAGGGNDYIDGGNDADVVFGEGGHDELFGGSGADVMAGDNSWIPSSEHGNDYLDGEAGNDTIAGGGGDDEIFGGADDDNLNGEQGDDYLDGEAGKDVLFGGDGNDELFGGSEDDEAYGGNGSDYLSGDDGDDQIAGDKGGLDAGGEADTIYGGTGNDMIDAQGGDDFVDGGADNDTVAGGSGNDYLLGGTGDDQLQGGGDDDVLDGGDGTDVLFGEGGNDYLLGGANTDYLLGEAGNDQLYGGTGDDQLEGGDNDDTLDGGDGYDVLFGDAGNDYLRGGANNDSLIGGDDVDVLEGGDGDDLLFGDGGNDYLLGGANSDYLLGGAGDDTLDGGDGDDVYYINADEGNDHIVDSGGTDWLVLQGFNMGDIVLGVGSLKLTVASTGQEIHLDDFDPDDPYAAGGIEYFQFADGTVMSKTQLIDTLGFTPTATPDADVIGGTALAETIDALAGDDVVTARGGDDVVNAGDGADTVYAGDGNDNVFGGAGDDALFGEGGADALYGEAGNDLLAGGAGTDQLDGGDGDDTFLFAVSDGQDTAVDTLGQNRVTLAAGLTLDNAKLSRAGNDLLITVSADDRLTVKDWFATDYHFSELVLGDGTVLDRAAVEAAMPSNQAPVANPDQVAVSEDGTTSVSANALADDLDPEGRALRVSDPGTKTGTYGSLSLQADGSFAYALANSTTAVQSLSAGQSVTDQFAYTVSDDDPNGAASASSSIIVTVAGRNDLPVLGTDTAATQEDATAPLTGNVLANDNDIDAGTTLAIVDAGARNGTYGTLNLGADGAYSYSLGSAVQSLAAGQTVTENFAISVSDGIAVVGGNLSIGIAGQNDAPIVVAPLADQAASANASWTWQVPAGSFADVDAGDVLSFGATLADGSPLPSWLSFSAETQTFSGRVPKSAVDSLDLRVSATDREGANAADVFTLSFDAATGGGGSGGGGGGGSQGNEGVGNGADAPPPGHDISFNDGAGSAPGHPGAQGGNGYRPPNRADIAKHTVRIDAPDEATMMASPGASANAPGQIRKTAETSAAAGAASGGKGVAEAGAHDGDGSETTDTAAAEGVSTADAPTRSNADDAEQAWLALLDESMTAPDGAGVEPSQPAQDGFVAEWRQVDTALAAHLIASDDHFGLSTHPTGKPTAGLPFLATADDPLAQLAAAAGLERFQGLKEGFGKIA